MSKVVHCRDVGFDCEGVVRAATQEEALEQVAAHAVAVYGLTEVTEGVVAKVLEVMREE
jgi:predicted small metal-binding protein